MRAVIVALAALMLAGCGQEADHPDFVSSCDPGECTPPIPGGSSSGNQGGSDSGGGNVDVVSFSGDVVMFASDNFEAGKLLTSGATISAEGASRERVSAMYDGMTYTIEDVAIMPLNWFLIEPVNTGFVPTIMPIDTRVSPANKLTVGIAQTLTLDGIFALMGNERSDERAQVALRVFNSSQSPIPGVIAEASAERIAYRAAGSWVVSNEGTDNTGQIFLANMAASSSLSLVDIKLSGSVETTVEVGIKTGAVTSVSIIATPL